MGLFNKRAKAIEAYADDNGLIHQKKDGLGLHKYFKQTKLLRHAGKSSLTSIISSETDSTVEQQHGTFEFTFIVSTGTTTVTVVQTVFYCIDKSSVLPQFHMFPEKWYHRLGKRFGVQDINLPEYPVFSKKFMLQTDDPDLTRKLFNDNDITFFLEGKPKWSLEAVGYYLILYRSGKVQPIEEFDQLIEDGLEINRLLRKGIATPKPSAEL